MKLTYGLFLLAIAITATILLLDHRNETKVYSFCTAQAVGNSLDDVRQSAEISEINLMQLDQNTWLFEQATLSPFSQAYVCEIKVSNQKITQLNFIKN